MDRTMTRADLLVVIAATVIGILLSAVFLWIHAGESDIELDAGVTPLVRLAWRSGED
jgi:hypothetical protein